MLTYINGLTDALEIIETNPCDADGYHACSQQETYKDLIRQQIASSPIKAEVDVTLAELKEALQDATLHFTQRTFSTRPCTTCELVSKIIKKPFGCKDLERDSKRSD